MLKMPAIDPSKPKLCVAGAGGRMGIMIIQEARAHGMETVGAVEASTHPQLGQTLSEMGITDQATCLVAAEKLAEALKKADVFVSFSVPTADLVNIPEAVKAGKRIILGTTGFNSEQNRQIIETLSGKVPAVFSPNYSVGVNILFKVAEQLKAFPAGFDVSLSEIHHTGKKDAPSGTAKKLEQIISQARGYSKTVYGREGVSPRQGGELESVALRAGGVPGIHDIIVAGPNEMLRIEHTAFSRNVFAQGAVLAAEWINKQAEPKLYSMADVLGLA
jgi:4-hydroxy-tetrahydrodipicolinate reductase